MLVATLISCADGTGARAAKTGHITYSQQTLMEMLVEDLPDRSLFRKKARPWSTPAFTPCCTWKGVGCDEHENVLQIWWVSVRLSGPLSFRSLPWTLSNFVAESAWLDGTCDLTDLPSDVETFSVRGNRLTGAVDLTALPEKLKQLNLSENQFFGSLDLVKVPDSVETIILSNNAFTGSLDLESLPRGIVTFEAKINRLEGSLTFNKLPPRMRRLNLQRNIFGGDLAFFDLPEHLENIDLTFNGFSGSVTFARDTGAHFGLTEIDMLGNAVTDPTPVDAKAHRRIVVNVPQLQRVGGLY